MRPIIIYVHFLSIFWTSDLKTHSLFDVFQLFVFMWFCEVWVVGQQVDHVWNDILRKKRHQFF